MIRAILGAQLRSMRMFRIGSSRNALFSLAVALLWYGFWTGAGVFVFGLTSKADSRAALANWLPAGMLAIFLYWQIAPMVTASFGASLDLRKLLVYPIPRGKLFTVEVLLRLSTCGEMLLVLAGGAAGLVANPALGGWRAVPPVLAAALLFIVFNLLLAAGLRSLIERLLSHKRIREVFVLLLVLATALPRLLVASGVRTKLSSGPSRLPELGPGRGARRRGWLSGKARPSGALAGGVVRRRVGIRALAVRAQPALRCPGGARHVRHGPYRRGRYVGALLPPATACSCPTRWRPSWRRNSAPSAAPRASGPCSSWASPSACWSGCPSSWAAATRAIRAWRTISW